VNRAQTPPGRPVVFGEVLFDQFEDAAVLGGAPFNVAWHLQGFGVEPLFISRVGRDDSGKRVRQAMQNWSMDTSGLQDDDAHPTGLVKVTLQAGEPSYDIVADVAYDFIDTGPALAAVERGTFGLIYHGSLAVRRPRSGQTLATLKNALGVPAFVDINLRSPWWQRDTAMALLSGAQWVKLNRDEMQALMPASRPASAGSLIPAAEAFRQACSCEVVFLTLGEEGAVVLTGDGSFHQSPPQVDRLVDAVGAGDAFSAVAILGLLYRWPFAKILACAVEFAARLCQQRGATIDDPGVYHSYLQRWQA